MFDAEERLNYLIYFSLYCFFPFVYNVVVFTKRCSKRKNITKIDFIDYT